jgi:hypothetical protein
MCGCGARVCVRQCVLLFCEVRVIATCTHVGVDTVLAYLLLDPLPSGGGLRQDPDSLYASRPAALLLASALDVWPPSHTPEARAWALALAACGLPGDEAVVQAALSAHVLAPGALQSLLQVDVRGALTARGELLPLLEACCFAPQGGWVGWCGVG